LIGEDRPNRAVRAGLGTGMTGFSASDAALEGFRISRERPRVLLGWTLFTLFASVVGAVITITMPKEARAALDALANEQAPDLEALLEMLTAVSPILIVGLLVQRMMDAAVYRVILRGGEGKFAYLRLGPDELRLAALRLIFLVLAVLLIAVVQFCIAILAVVASPLGQGPMLLVAFVAEVFSWGVILMIAVRMSLASVITFETGKLSILESWELTRGQFWPLLSSYALAGCCILATGIAVMVLFVSMAGVALIATGGSLGDLSAIMAPKEISLQTYLNPYVVAYTLIGCVFTAIYSAVIAAPGAFVYLALKGRQTP
jgi:hypothetical protein